ncbi:MAG: aminoglycoside phosphotransferase family protein [Propionicimonas sp.]|uniref:phosphotransferase family protein n=1 Tax=Propionicimonas sp. TaxID=1955623 RepID=UPI003D0B9E14
MESITKNRQSPETLRRMVARAYGPDQVVDSDDFAVELGHGWFNVAYRIGLRDGRQVVLKIAPPPGVSVMTYEHDMMRNEVAALELVQAHTGVPVPAVDHFDDSLELCDAPWFFMPFIEADNFGILAEEGALSPEQTESYNEQLGAMNAALNSIVGPHYGPLAGPGFPTWRDAFASMISDVLEDGERAGLDLGWDYALVRQVIADHLPVLDAITEPRFVEWDLWNSNTMVREGRIVAIIDHERAFYGDPLIEAGFTAIDLPAFGDPAAFMRGYGHSALTEAEQHRRRLYTLYLILIMIIETHYRGHETPAQYDWARAQLDQLMGAFGHTE